VRRLYLSVRLAATVMAVAAAAGCMSVGDDPGGSARPSHSAGQRDGGAPGGGTAVSCGGVGAWGAADGKHGKKGAGKAEESASASASPSAGASRSAPASGKPGRTGKPGAPTPTGATPTPTRSVEPPPTPSEPPTSASPEPPPSAEPSSSAHEQAAPQLAQREPAPTAGSPA
jgi:hypothetical protein